MAAEETEWREEYLKDIVKQFCNVTNCGEDDAEAMIVASNFILHDAINEYYENGLRKVQMNDAIGNQKEPETSHSGLRLITWNIDGLSHKDLTLRTLAVTEKINSLLPDIVYLQEVIDTSLELIGKQCKGYTIHHHKIASYFCAILIRKMPSLVVVSKGVTEFPQSKMGRFLLSADILFNGSPVSLLTSHLESTQASKQERMNQLMCCFEEMATIGNTSLVILAGDLNLRDDEVKKIGGLKSGIKDAWIETGSDTRTKFSWDMTLNDNLVMQGNRKPKCRFDRVYYRSPDKGKVQPKNFDLIGKERLVSCDCFASDHWGIMCEFSLED